MAGAHVIDIDQLIASSTVEQLEKTNPLIHKINSHIRDEHRSAYNPMMLSIGPYNYGIPAAHGMQVTKYKYLDYILSLNPKKSLSDFVEAMKELEEQVRTCYKDEINMGRLDFLKMLLLDGCFILGFLCRIEGSVPAQQEPNKSKKEIDMSTHKDLSQPVTDEESIQYVEEDSYPMDQLYSHGLWHDLLLQENQIPFFVITKIHELVGVGSSTARLKLIENVIEYIEVALHCYQKAICQPNRPKSFYHLLQLCHMYFMPNLVTVESYNEAKPRTSGSFLQLGSNLFSKYKAKLFHQQQQSKQQANPWRRATEYHRARLEFKKRIYCAENPHSLLDIRFCNGMIELPCLTIEPNTQTLFCNLIAFEQTCPQFGCYVSAYITFIASLISMPDDVSLLTHRGIIVHQLNNDEAVCDLFRTIGECTTAIEFHRGNYLEPVYNRIEAHYTCIGDL